MDLPELLEVIQVQRHDFLNHLQVIYGLIQLNKPEQLKEYTERIIEEMKPLSAVTRLNVPELKAVILIALKEAQKHQIDFKFNINTTLQNCPLDGKIMGQGVEFCLRGLWEYLTLPEVTVRTIVLGVVEHENAVCVLFSLPGLTEVQIADLQHNLLENLASLKKQVRLTLDQQGEFCLRFPIAYNT